MALLGVVSTEPQVKSPTCSLGAGLCGLAGGHRRKIELDNRRRDSIALSPVLLIGPQPQGKNCA